MQDAIDEVNGKFDNYVSTGLVVYSSRVAILAGGYQVNGSLIYVDMVIKLLVNTSANYGLIGGFPAPLSTGKIAYAYDVYMQEQLGAAELVDAVGLSAGTVLRVVAAYEKA